ncbi:ATPase subunit of ABC transporter with duplicated ATPase domains [Melghirimyces profundicolus]|uniref:ATPase subunit of ABC transporter with duplicated ATPase domains n=1 Tax=Melghirimyces profundicolus TaxID=1242148 RepID=A0A2T6B0M4_9BACL|nr:ABC-F family ATP-binding cassette domain-containing protein [Melghirimyces profundicolus]PTX49621.1 ATPase subunit of ABC transporter with duplicated ATPase domains [Melghirimyces profundicolus]
MYVLKAEGLKVERDGRPVFDHVDLEIREGERVALIGRNGVGKTTLLECLVGKLPPDRGSIHRRWPVSRWGMVEQKEPVPSGIPLLELVRAGDPEKNALKTELKHLERRLSHADEGTMEELLPAYAAVQEQYQSAGGYEWERETEVVLKRMGFSRREWGIPFEGLSGGQKTRAQLARLVVRDPAFLLLDEPTNHLDEETLDWLTDWLTGFKGACLIVSHDRAFIDRVAHTTVELTPEGSRSYRGGYSDFSRERERERREQEALYRKQERERRKLEESIRRYREWFNRAHAAAGERNPFYKKKATKHQTRSKAKEKALGRLEREMGERPGEDPRIRVRFDGSDFGSRTLIRMTKAAFTYGEEPVLRDVTLTVNRGDRLAVSGRNGSGKSTLLKLMAGKLEPVKGEIIRHPKMKVGYFAQELEELHPDETILESLLPLPGMKQAEARNILAAFLFRQEEVHRKIGQLSVGERCRVAFVKLYVSGVDLMVMDEPTNYLDISTRERIEEALFEYPGTLVIVSHDRYLLDRVSNKVAFLKGGKVEVYPGSYREYRTGFRERAERPDPETDRRLRFLELERTRLMAEEEPEGEEEKKALERRIRHLSEQIHEWKS